MIALLASSVSLIVISCPARRLFRSLTIRSTILPMFSLLNDLKMIVSSIRFRNSGRKCCFSLFITVSRISSVISPPPSAISTPPIFDVIMMIVFLKSTVLPCESVIRPSSNTCNNTLNTSGCAFSTSSNKTTEYGFLRTASVSCPPSS